MTTKIIITPASHGLSKASLAGAPRTVRVVTVGAPTASRTGTGVTQTRTVLTPSAGGVRTILSPSANGVRTVLKRVYSATRPVETSAVTSVPALPAVPVPPRKRQRLDHLTADQKNQRRKLKNRVAAQTARDRKKLQMDLLENRVTSLERQNDELLQQNKFLQKQNELLSQQNALLLQRLESSAAATPARTASPAPVAASACPAASPAPVAVSASPVVAARPASVESAALISGPQQKGQESGRAVAALLALSLLTWAGFQTTLAATALNRLICSSYSARPYSASKSRREGTRPPPALLWWGPQQKSWSPAMIR